MPGMDESMSFEETLHRRVLAAGDPAAALAAAVAVIEEELAPAGALLYAIDAGRRPVGLAGRLREAFTGELSFFDDDPCQDRARAVLSVSLVHATRLIARRPHERSTAYREFYGPRRLEHVVCMRLNGLPHSSPGMRGLFLARSDADGDFDGAQKRRLHAALPLLAALDRERLRQERLRRVLDGLASADDVWRPLLVVSAEGELLWTSGRARELLASASEAAALRLLATVREACAAGRSPRGATIELGAAGLWALELSPLDGGVLLGRLRPAREPEARLAERHGLTPAEAAVLACLGVGMSNVEIAASLSIATATAATHVKRVLGKMGVTSRLQAGLLMQRELLLD